MLSDDSRTAIGVTGLRKSFGPQRAVDNVDFTVRAGEIFGFLGPNGAGKTTTINMLTGLARPDTGAISYFGVDYTANIKRAQHLMGVVPDESNLYPELSGRDNLEFCASLYGIPRARRRERAAELLEVFDLADAADKKFQFYSKGMKRKLTIAAGIIHQPGILFLDEPTTGIDVASARRIREMLAGLNRDGTTIFLTTHYIEEAERLCDRIAFIVAGRIVRLGPLDELMAEVEKEHVLEISPLDGGHVPRERIESEFPVTRTETHHNGAVRVYSSRKLHLGPLFRMFEDQGVEIAEARLVRPSLEEVFVRVTGIEIERMKDQPAQASGGGKGR